MDSKLPSGSVKVELSRAILTSQIFKGLPRQSILSILERASSSDCLPGETLYLQAQPAREFFLLESGLVRLHEVTSEGDDILVQLIAPGDVFGFFALSSGVNIASAEVVLPSRIFRWDAATAIQILGEFPRLATNLLQVVLKTSIYLYQLMCRYKSGPVTERVQWALAHLARVVGKKTEQGFTIEYAGSQRMLADLAGTTIYTVSRELSNLERRGILCKERGRIVLLRPDELRGD